MTDHPFFLREALKLATIRKGSCAPNPSVGAVIVREGKIIATGYHYAPGHAHAEVEALKKNPDTQDATLYVTLEPCCHFGRTPPCTDAIIKANIKKVIYGFKDPNPLVAGKGEAALNKANIDCEFLPIPEITDFYKSYYYWTETQKPFITAKIAMTLDGKIADKNSGPISITGKELQELTHHCRKQSDAILTTVKTIICDNPQMNVRYANEIIAKPLFILDSRLDLPLNATVCNTAESITLFHSANASYERKKNLLDRGIHCVEVTENNNKLDLAEIITIIGQKNIHDLWIEAGGKCFSEFLSQKLLHRALIYIAPKFQGIGIAAFNETECCPDQVRWQTFGNDILCEMSW